jgi:glycosyltransferase involved in cell wall biosynthesis
MFCMKRVAVNTRFLQNSKMEGFGWYTYETISRLVHLHPEIQFYFFFDRPFNEKFVFAKNVTPIVLHPQARHPILFKIWFDFSVRFALRKYKIDLFISPDGYLSLTSPVKQLAVIHDLNFEYFPKDLPRVARKFLKSYFPRYANKASHILTVSEFSKKDIVSIYKINHSKITVAYNGVSPMFKPISIQERHDVKLKFTNSNDYFLFVGAIHPRKNLTRLLLAFDLFKRSSNSTTKLVIVGDSYYWTSEMKDTLKNMFFKDDLVFTGHLKASELVQLYGAAKALAFVSYFEGFGIPVVEAMKCGCPVLVGEKTACAEIGGEAVLLCNPFSVESIQLNLSLLDNDELLRQKLIDSGFEQSKNFSWDTTAQTMSRVMSGLLA